MLISPPVITCTVRLSCRARFSPGQVGSSRTGAPGYRPFDQLQELGRRAGVEGANWKRFRHSLSTHGKQRFGMTKEQVQAQLRHTTAETQERYAHLRLVLNKDGIVRAEQVHANGVTLARRS